MSRTLTDLWQARFGLPPAPGADAEPSLQGAPLESIAGIVGRRTVRRYRPEPVPEALLDTLLACAQSAPSKSDLQQYAVVVVEASERGAFAERLPSMPWVGSAPVFLMFCGDARRARLLCEQWGRPHANDSLDTFFNTAVDAALAMGAFILAAEAAGLGCCPISHVRNFAGEVADLLRLPPGVYPVAGLCVGWPAEPDAAPLSMRLPPSVVVHRGRYRDERLPEAVADYDKRRNERQPIAPEKQKNADVHGVSEVCTWSDQVTRQLSVPERPDFRRFIEGQGFALK